VEDIGKNNMILWILLALVVVALATYAVWSGGSLTAPVAGPGCSACAKKNVTAVE
jgi:hypothetical protein